MAGRILQRHPRLNRKSGGLGQGERCCALSEIDAGRGLNAERVPAEIKGVQIESQDFIFTQMPVQPVGQQGPLQQGNAVVRSGKQQPRREIGEVTAAAGCLAAEDRCRNHARNHHGERVRARALIKGRVLRDQKHLGKPDGQIPDADVDRRAAEQYRATIVAEAPAIASGMVRCRRIRLGSGRSRPTHIKYATNAAPHNATQATARPASQRSARMKKARRSNKEPPYVTLCLGPTARGGLKIRAAQGRCAHAAQTFVCGFPAGAAAPSDSSGNAGTTWQPTRISLLP